MKLLFPGVKLSRREKKYLLATQKRLEKKLLYKQKQQAGEKGVIYLDEFNREGKDCPDLFRKTKK